MAKAREPVSSGISSGEEETENSSSEEIGSEPSPPPAAATKPQPKTPSAIIPAQDSESESDRKARKKSKSKKSRARSTRKRAVEEVKGTEPTVTKKSKNSKKAREPVEETDDSSSEDIGSEPEQIRKTSPPPAAASASAARSRRKRAVEEDKGTEPAVTKKSKKSKKAEPEKKQPFQRIWSEADEITILNGILQFRAQKKSDLNENFDAFFEFIKKNLQIEATRSQLRDKISRMKKKYTNNKRKEHDGKGRTFTSQHEREAYDLSEKVWGAEKENGNGSGSEKENPNGSGAEKEHGIGSGSEKENPNGSGAEKENAAGEKENMVEKGNGSGSERRFVWMSESLLRGSGDVPAVEDKEGEMGNKEDDEALENLEIEEMKVYLRLFELKAEKAKLFVQTMIKSRGH
ncbi:DNA-binding storekeeper protein-relatedtranscriptional regulator [Striga asiatica]|uniref:DNA-binding storekeeper protein-relatedtranscriptional regulator n=1 Tax=Striga asiatica TaxID=4170 RepID=A0A5A7QWA1_STRAF|nr:DNA-binding storekeeper protein-relatedtranscriptional regulator [Striga asiatica]